MMWDQCTSLFPYCVTEEKDTERKWIGQSYSASPPQFLSFCRPFSPARFSFPSCPHSSQFCSPAKEANQKALYFSLYFCLAFSFSLSLSVQSTSNCITTVHPVALFTLLNNLLGPWCHDWCGGQLRVDPGAPLLVAPGACAAGRVDGSKMILLPPVWRAFHGCLEIFSPFIECAAEQSKTDAGLLWWCSHNPLEWFTPLPLLQCLYYLSSLQWMLGCACSLNTGWSNGSA